MTEQQWLTSTNPADLVAFLGERITDEQARHLVACGSTSSDGLPFACDAIRDIVGNPFRQYSVIRGVVWAANRPDGKPEEIVDLSWNGRTIPLMVDAMMNEQLTVGCSECSGEGHFVERGIPVCLACKGTGSVVNKGASSRPRAEPRWEMMPIIADALEEAGCRDQHLLEHLRSERDGEQCPWCRGDGWTMELGYVKFQEEKCPHCKGTGRIKRRHWKGCHILEVLTHGI